ncbi:lymphatic vessel endothelial hyaluronic receptor 1b [Thalassophryne amazonica]|uniref:lymphatic vessel endothelial hyaluronic receptor 1b n=1 Tax=Thalassophryne amazonica TaxID=390379 RepID=UPI0014711361|nr:lymphatic vessel endothelial hyaluronic receptor 1b [Thalassophryne amazonica]
MARFWFVTEVFFPLSATVFLLAFDSSQTKVPGTESVSGVFLITEGGNYTFNFTTAKAACLFRNVTIATRVQMLEALQHGLETCKFGWIAEQVAVVPRIMGNKNCGQNRTGLVTWRTQAGRLFGVFCFNAADLNKTLTSSSTVTALPTVTPLLTSESRHPSSAKPTAAEVSSPTSLFTQLDQTTHSAALSSTTHPLKHFSSYTPPFSNFITSSVTVHISPSASVSSTSLFSESVLSPSVQPVEPSLGAVPIALIVLGVTVLVTVAGAVCFYKLNIFSSWCGGQQDDIETEMWKQGDAETDLHSHHGAEEETNRMLSNNVLLFENPDVKTVSLE